MKKRVRIYKAQQGGATQQQNISETDLMNKTYSLISEGSEPEEALNALMAAGVEQDLANRAVSAVVSYMNDEEAKVKADLTDDVEAKEDLMAEEQADADEATREAEYESRKEALQEMYYGDDTDPGYEEEDQVMEQLVMRRGGNLPSKRTFIKNYIKQAGGSQETGRADSTGSDVRSENLSKFVGTLKNTGNQALMKEDAEAMYSAMQAYQDGGDVESGVMAFDPYHNLAHYSDAFEHAMPSDETEMFRAQFGGNLTRGQQRRMNRRFNRILGNMPMGFYSGQQSLFPGGMNIYTMGNMPTEHYQPARGSYYGGVQLANIDVRRTGIFGRPKEYTINFFNPNSITTAQDVSNVIRQEENNIKETVKEAEVEKKEDAVNTSTEKNEKVQETASKETPAVTTTAAGSVKGTSATTKKPVQSSGNKGAVEVPVSKKQIVKVIATPTSKEFAEYQRKKYVDNAAKVAANKAKVEANRAKVSQQKTGITPIPIYSGEINPFIPSNPLVQKVGFFQSGGFVDPSNPELYKFIYGGSDDLAVPTVPGKLTDDPYFEYGGLVKAQKGLVIVTDRFGNTKKITADEAAIWQKSKAENPNVRLEDISFASEAPVEETETETETVDYNQYYPDNNIPYYLPRNRGFLGLGAYGANPVFQNAGMWAQQQGLPYDPRTGQVLTSIPSNLNLQSIDVRKSGLLSGLPKKYTLYFEGQGAPGNAIDKAYTPGTWYKGSDGQMHYIGESGEQAPASKQTEGRRNKLADFLIKSRIAPGLGADMIAGKESFSETEASSYDPTGLSARQRRADENYRKQYGHYPGEGKSRSYGPGVETLPFRPLDADPSEGLTILPSRKSYTGKLPFIPSQNTAQYMQYITKKYGGLTKAQDGLNTFSASASDIPPGYFKDPATGLIKNLAGEIYQPKSKLPNAQGMLTNDFQYKKNPLTQEAPAIKMGQDGNYENTGLLTEKDKQDANKQQMAVDVKNQNAVTVDFQAGLDQVNKYGNMFAQMLEGKDNADRQRKLYDQLVAENIYGSTNVKDRGTYDINSGLFKQDEMGFTGVVKYGGNIMQEGGYMDDEDYYGYEEEYQGEEGEETYMTPGEIEEFFANGGDLEFI